MANDHLKYTRSERGLRYFPALPTISGTRIQLYDSSLATEPAVWLDIDVDSTHAQGDAPAAIQLSTTVAAQLAEQLHVAVWGHPLEGS